MSIREFTQASASKHDLSIDDMMERCRFAEYLSQRICQYGSKGIQRLVPGVGLVYYEDTLLPTILLDRWLYDHPQRLLSEDPDRLFSALDFPDLIERLVSVYELPPGVMRDDLHILPVSGGVRHSRSGTYLQSTSAGKVGPHVTWNGGQSEGFLTAGHVAQTLGGTVIDASGSLLGTVVWTFDPSKSSSSNGELDAALVEFDPSHSATTGQSSIVVAANDTVTISAGTSADILGYWAHLVIGNGSDFYANCYATKTTITAPGDSGDLVGHNGNVVGIVIGAFKGRNMTVIQAIDYQIKEVSSRSGRKLSL